MTAKQTKYVYWTCTGVFSLLMTMSGAFSVMAGPQVREGMAHLGYPLYFAVMLGVAKLLGVAVLLANRPTRMKEWAYAGFVFDLIAATVSYAAVGDSLVNILAPIGFFAVLMGSYYCWHRMQNTPEPVAQRRAA